MLGGMGLRRDVRVGRSGISLCMLLRSTLSGAVDRLIALAVYIAGWHVCSLALPLVQFGVSLLRRVRGHGPEA